MPPRLRMIANDILVLWNDLVLPILDVSGFESCELFSQREFLPLKDNILIHELTTSRKFLLGWFGLPRIHIEIPDHKNRKDSQSPICTTVDHSMSPGHVQSDDWTKTLSLDLKSKPEVWNWITLEYDQAYGDDCNQDHKNHHSPDRATMRPFAAELEEEGSNAELE